MAPRPSAVRSSRSQNGSAHVQRGRLGTLGVVFTLVIAGLGFRVADLQLTPDPAYAEPMGTTVRHDALPARRGTVVDRTGRPLAISLPSATIVADPRLVPAERLDDVVATLGTYLSTDPETIRSRLSSDRHFVYLERQVDPTVGDAIMELDLPGVYLEAEPRRQYPNGDCTGLALLGRVDIDHQGISGLEKIYQDELTGTPGTLMVEVGFNRSATIAGGERVVEPAIPGVDLPVTLDRDLQFKAQELMEEAVVASGASMGTALVMVPSTGEIVAAVSVETDPETGEVACSSNNLPFTHAYEPGSTLKTVTMAAVLDQGLATPNEEIPVDQSRTWPIDQGRVFTATDYFTHEALTYTPTEILARSSNVGMTVLADRVGSDSLYQSFLDFGLGQRTGIAFPGETPGIVNPFESTLARPTASYGQGVATTPIQVLQVYNTIANGGIMVDPVLVSSKVGVAETRQVVSAQSANQVMAMLRSVVDDEYGTGKQAAIPGYDVAGKTGTAWQPCGENGVGYTCVGGGRHYTASFAGVVSNDDGPQFTVLVVIDKPTGANYAGGAVAAPVFAEIATYAARQLRVPATMSAVTTTAVRAQPAASLADEGPASEVP